jgi:hypothetical protein
MDDHVRFSGTKYEKGNNNKHRNHCKCGAHRSKLVGWAPSPPCPWGHTEAFFLKHLRKETKPPAWSTVSVYVLGAGFKPANNTFPCSCARAGGGARFCMIA